MITNSRDKLLLVGCGDIGLRLARQLSQGKFAITGLRRNIQFLPDFIEPLACDLSQEDQVMKALRTGYDYIVITLTPSERSEAGYKQAFLTNLQYLIRALQHAGHVPKRVFFTSSTSVYAQNQGEWVNEASPTEPDRYNGKLVLQAEQQLLNSKLPTTVVRFSGIYGSERTQLISKVQRGDWDLLDDHYTNRIHADDCAGVLAFLLARCQSNQSIAPLYLASDNEPAPMNQVCSWLAQQLRLSEPQAKIRLSEATNNKRCDNRLLREAGYQCRYPSYREGYLSILRQK